MEAAVYLRQSVDRLGDALAITRQREDCLALCEKRGWTAHEYVDNDKSASKGRRPAYESMLDDIRAGAIDAVVVWDLDRLHRRPMELEHFIDLADAKHLKLASVGGDADLSTDNGRLFARIKGAVARAEIERKSARMKRAARQRAEAGICGGTRPFGYAESGNEFIECEAAALREAYAMGNSWSGRALKRTLIRPRYAGHLFFGDEILGKARAGGGPRRDLARRARHRLRPDAAQPVAPPQTSADRRGAVRQVRPDGRHGMQGAGPPPSESASG